MHGSPKHRDTGQSPHPRFQLPDPGPTRILRWDICALYQALNDHRQARGMSWRDLSSSITAIKSGVIV